MIAQFNICFEQLCFFCDAQQLTISNEAGPIAASTLLHVFLEKLETDYFFDRRALLYGPGKKYLEIMTVLINEPSIDLNFRTLQIIHLLSDEGLSQSCAEGCLRVYNMPPIILKIITISNYPLYIKIIYKRLPMKLFINRFQSVEKKKALRER